MTAPLCAQIFPADKYRSIFWDGNAPVLYDSFDHSIGIADPKHPGRLRKVELGGSKELVAFETGTYWAQNKLISTNPKSKPVRQVFSSRDIKEWTLEAWIPITEEVDVDEIHPIRGDRFLLIAFTRIVHDGKSSRFALATRKEDKGLVIDEVLEMGLAKPWAAQKKEENLASHFGVNSD